MKKKICFVIPSMQVGGMERVFSQLLEFFSNERNYELHLIIYGKNREVFYNIPNDVKIHRPQFEFNNQFRLFFTLITMLYLRRTIRCLKPMSILSFGEIWNSFFLLSVIGLKTNVVVSDRCQPNKNIGTINELLRRILYPKAAGIICQTEIAKNIFKEKINSKKFIVIGNPIRIQTVDCNELFYKKEKIIISVGRLINSKNHDDLIDIFNSIGSNDWKLYIIGDDSLKQKNKDRLNKKIIDLGISHKVFLLGSIKKLDDYYRVASIFAFTSDSEGFPNVIGEAMSWGVPVVSYDCIAGPSDIIQNSESGYLIELYNKTEFANRLKELMDDQELRIRFGKQALNSIKSNDINLIGRKFESVLLYESDSNK
jgi:GalNAc-alpha-(1->4)-GalNAc-alpha-(1->3)-diNAcBac-PP-undecaprenol alpha-1,4-N-acetyl-D-galactosaminyltransferase